MICSKCKKDYPESHYLYAGIERKWCKDCRDKRYKQPKRVLTTWGKWCPKCNQEKDYSEFKGKQNRQLHHCQECRDKWSHSNLPIQPKDTSRQLSKVSDIIIAIMVGEAKTKNQESIVKEISAMLNRDKDLIRKRIEHLQTTGKLSKLHEKLMKENGVYAIKMRRLGKCD